MIDIKSLRRPRDVGRWVMYTAMGDGNVGRIKDWNDQWIHVVYHCREDWDNFQKYTGAATAPRHLDFIPDPTTKSEREQLNEILSQMENPGIVTGEKFIEQTRIYREAVRRDGQPLPPEVRTRVELIAKVIPENQPVEFWAGFYTGVMAMTGGVVGTMEQDHSLVISKEDIRALGHFIVMATCLAWNQQYGAPETDEFFDAAGKEDIV